MIICNSELDYELDLNGHFEFTEGGPTLLLDGDPIAYSSAAACDSAEHLIKLNGTTIYNVQGGITELYNALSFKDYREFNVMLEKNPDITYEKLVTSDDGDNMKHTIKAQIRKIIKRAGAGSVKIYLTDGASNFRLTENIATILKYKGNRSPDAKPQMLGIARQYMLDELGCVLCIGLEADDQLSIDHRASWKLAMEAAEDFHQDDPDLPISIIEKTAMKLATTVLATIDKDIKMCAGLFINPDQDLGIEEIFPLGHLFLEVKVKANKPDTKKLRFSGLRGFYAQLLSGDSCDNIPTAYGCGDVRVYEVLNGCENEEQLFKATLREIIQAFHREHLKALGDDIMSRTDKAIATGLHGNDNPSNRVKVKKKFKTLLEKTVAFGDKHFYHWDEYLLKEDGTVSRDLRDPENAIVRTISPLGYMLEVARLVYMLEVAPAEDGSHLWTPPNPDWVQTVLLEEEEANLIRIPMDWPL